ncbi:MAG: sugar ABC transporter substrate-binding protein [Planctomycetota bacterium]|nr:MAG: sugar ABC transporter substrate-binding protein [Planctomycetota bacterium]
MTRFLRLLLLLLPAAAAIAACGGGAADATAGAPRIAVIPKGTTHEFWKAVHAGVEQAARDLGLEAVWKGPLKEDDRASQIRVVEDFIAAGVDGIVLMPLDDRALVPVAKEAAAQGIPVVIADSDLDWDGRVSFVATDNHHGGELAADALAERLGGRGRVLMMRYMEGSASTMAREQGFLDRLAANWPEIEVVSSNQYAGATTESAYQTAENLLQSFPQVDGIFCPNESSTFGMLRALQDAGRAGQVRFAGFDASEKLVAALRAGEIDALVLQDPVAMGRLAVHTLWRHLQGEPVEPRVDTGARVATGDNLDDPAIAALLAPDLSILGE